MIERHTSKEIVRGVIVMIVLQSYVLTVSAYVFKSNALVLLVYPGKYPYLCELKNSLFLCWQ